MHLSKKIQKSIQITAASAIVLMSTLGLASVASAGGYYDHVPTDGTAVCMDGGGITLTAHAENIYDWPIDLTIYEDGLNASVLGITPGTVGEVTLFLPDATTFSGEINGEIDGQAAPYNEFTITVNIAATPLECCATPVIPESTVPVTTPETTTTTVPAPSTTVAPTPSTTVAPTTSTTVAVVPVTAAPSTTVPVEIGDAAVIERHAPTVTTPVASTKELALTGGSTSKLMFVAKVLLTAGIVLATLGYLYKTNTSSRRRKRA